MAEEKEFLVTARKCEHCNHHEVGIMDTDGNYTQLKLGTIIKVVDKKEQTVTEWRNRVDAHD